MSAALAVPPFLRRGDDVRERLLLELPGVALLRQPATVGDDLRERLLVLELQGLDHVRRRLWLRRHDAPPSIDVALGVGVVLGVVLGVVGAGPVRTPCPRGRLRRRHLVAILCMRAFQPGSSS